MPVLNQSVKRALCEAVRDQILNGNVSYWANLVTVPLNLAYLSHHGTNGCTVKMADLTTQNISNCEFDTATGSWKLLIYAYMPAIPPAGNQAIGLTERTSDGTSYCSPACTSLQGCASLYSFRVYLEITDPVVGIDGLQLVFP